MNGYIRDLVEVLESRYSIDSKSMPYSEWICKNTTIRGRPMSFKRYPFQVAITDDMHPNMDVIKCSQVGITEVQIRKALAFLIRNQGVTAIYTLPNEKMYRKLSKSRIKPVVDENRVFRPDNRNESRSMDLMQFGRSFLHIANATEGEATSTSADAVFNDEVDLSDQKMLALFNSRLQNSDFKLKQRFSTPTFNGFGIDLSYSASDQREYVIRCEACNHVQIPVFTREFVMIPGLPDHVSDLSEIDDIMAGKLDLPGSYVMCEKCHRALDLDDSDNRFWVAKYNDRNHARGYRVRPFSTGRLGVQYIVEQLLDYRRRDFIRGWYNTVLGEPYTDGNIRLTERDIRACMVGAGVPEVGDSEVAVGIDIGQSCHITLGKPDGDGGAKIFKFYAVNANEITEEVKALMKTYNVVAGSVDMDPYTPTAEEIRDITNGVIMPVRYRGSKEIAPVKDAEGNITHFQGDRTKMLDEVAKRVRRHTLQMAGYGQHESVLITHLRDMVRDEQPEEPAKWIKMNGNDHFFHSLGYLLFGIKIKNLLLALDDSDQRVAVSFGGVGSASGVKLPGFDNRMQSGLYLMRETGNKKRRVVRY